MNFDDRRKVVRSVLFFVAALFATVVASFAQSFASAAPEPAEPYGPRYAATPADRAAAAAPPGTGPRIALTFDDGPSPRLTPYILDVLAAKGVPATFFLQGDHSVRYPELVRRVRDEGHAIGNHSWDHRYFPELSPQNAEEQIVRTTTALTDITGVRPTVFRYPFGEGSPASDAVLARTGYPSGGVYWQWASAKPGDFQCPGADALVDYVLTEAQDQAMILLHDAGDTVNCAPGQETYLPRVIDELRARGFTFGIVAPSATPSPINQGTRAVVVAG